MNNHLLSSKTGRGILLGLVASLLLCSGNASAQDYIGGSFSFTGGSSKAMDSATTLTGSHLSINVAPDLGWFIGDKWAVGIRPTIGFGVNSGKTISLGINPYARYQLLAYNRFGLWGEAESRLNYSQTKGENTDIRNTTYGVCLLPVLTYQLNSHISLESRLNLFSLSLLGSHADANGYEHNTINYGLTATTKDVTGALENISIGFLYKF